MSIERNLVDISNLEEVEEDSIPDLDLSMTGSNRHVEGKKKKKNIEEIIEKFEEHEKGKKKIDSDH